MPEAFQERRKPRPFRILHMSLEAFLRRFILRSHRDPVASASNGHPLQAPASTSEKGQSWRCGVTQLDEQNEALFQAIRQYQQALKSGNAGATEEALAFLEGHMEGHLALEEAYLEHIHFPGLSGHREGHRAFAHQIHAFHDRAAAGDPGVGLELSQLLYTWMREHVRREDPVWSEFAKASRRHRVDPAP